MSDCNRCLWATRNGSCASWDCRFIDQREAYEAYNREKADANKWIPCSERMPEPRIDVWCNSDLGQTVGYYDETCDMWFKNDYTELIVTAWMPLPDPYKEDKT